MYVKFKALKSIKSESRPKFETFTNHNKKTAGFRPAVFVFSDVLCEYYFLSEIVRPLK
jgi:hypothetical protein